MAKAKARPRRDGKEPSTVEVEKLFITGSGNLVTEEELKAYQVPQTQQIEEQKWGEQFYKPPYDLQKLMRWMEYSVAHASCIETKVQDTVGIGWRLREVEGKQSTQEQWDRLEKFFDKVNETEDIVSVSKKVCLDFEGCGNGYFEVIRPEKEDGDWKLYHVNATTIRLHKNKDRWMQKVGQKTVYFKRWGDERNMHRDTGEFKQSVQPGKLAHELIPIQRYTWRSAHYGCPEWLPAVYQMFAEQKEKEYNLDFFSSYGVPACAVVVTGGKLKPEAKEEIKKYFETELKKNPHKTMLFTLKTGATVKFEKLAVETKEASFRLWRKDNKDDILTAHHVPPYRAGIVIQGQLGGTVAREVDEIYLDSVINPRQREFEWVLTQLIIAEGFKIDSLEFEFEDIDIRDRQSQAEIDREYFNMGARTPNQILQAQGLDPYEGGDVYYVPGNVVPVGVEQKRKEDEEEDGNDPGQGGAVGSEVGTEEDDLGDYISQEETETETENA